MEIQEIGKDGFVLTVNTVGNMSENDGNKFKIPRERHDEFQFYWCYDNPILIGNEFHKIIGLKLIYNSFNGYTIYANLKK